MAESQIKWKEPREVTRARAQAARRTVPKMMLELASSIYVVAACLVLPAVVLIPSEAITWKWLLGLALPALLVSLSAASCFPSSRRYRLTPKGIGDDHGLWTWKALEGYRVRDHTVAPQHRSLRLYPKKGPRRPREMALPGGDIDEQIISAVAAEVPLLPEEPPPPEAPSPVGRKASACLYALCLAFGMVAGYAFSTGLGKRWFEVVAVATFAFGPGTIGCLALYRGKLFREAACRGVAFLFNFLGVTLMTLYTVVFLLRRLHAG